MSDQFQVVAATAGRERAIVLHLAEEIGQVFGVDLSGLIDALSDTGVCVQTADTMAEARRLAARITAIGADYRILDASGEEVDSQDATPPRIEARGPATGSRTMMGGFSAPELMEMAAAEKRAKEAAGGDKLELDDGGGFAAKNATIGEGAVGLGAAPKGNLELEDDGGFAAKNATIGEGAVGLGAAPKGNLELEDDGGFAAKNATIGEGAVGLGAAPKGNLELDDGGGFAAKDSTIAEGAVGLGDAAQQPKGEIELDGPGGFAAQGSTIGEGAMDIGAGDDKLELSGPGGFAAPASMKDGFDLDALDAESLVMLDGSSDSLGMSTGEPAKKPVVAEQPPPKVLDDASFRPPDDSLETDSPLELEEPAPPPKPTTAEAGAPEPGAPGASVDDDGELEWVPADRKEAQAAAEVSKSAEIAAPADSGISQSGPVAVERPRPSARRAPTGPLFLGGKLRRWPRARVALGFLLGIGLSSILPMCHASSVRSDRIGPLLVDLSTAKAHGAIMSTIPGYQPPEQIQGNIKSIQRRHVFYGVLLWSALAALLLFLWFRFT